MAPSPALRHSDLSRFAEEFKDESHLRAVLLELLQRSGAKGVRITHGHNERGKDLIFYKPGGLSKDVLYACVVKNDRITARADSVSGSQTVLNQALQAISEPYTDPATGREEKVHTAYIISPYECTTDATENIKAQLREKARHVEFLCGIDLLALFQEHWPDFLRFESAILTRYLNDLRSGLLVDNALVTLLTRHNATFGLKPFEAFYVPSGVEMIFDLFVSPKIPLPELTDFENYVTLEETHDAVSRMRFWRGALRSSEITGRPTSALERLSDFVERFASEIKVFWASALSTKRLRQSGTHVVDERQLTIPKDRRERYLEYLEICTTVRDKVLTIEKASKDLERVRRNSDESLPVLLGNANFVAVSAAYDFLSALPGMLTRQPGKRLKITPDVLFSRCRAVLLTGPPGLGKTSFCRWQTLRAIEEFSSEPTRPLPIYLAAHRLASVDVGSFDATFLGNVKADSASSLRLFLDGLDEVPDREKQRAIASALREGLIKYPALSVVVTSRPYVWGEWLNWLPRIQMAELQRDEQERLTRNWLGEENVVQAFFTELSSSPALERLMSVPLLATLILNLYRRVPTIPENKSSLYRTFVELYCGGWDAAKGLYKAGRFRNEQKLRPLSGLAYRMHLAHRADCSEAMFVKALEDTMPALTSVAGDFLNETIQDGILVRAGSDLLFAHLSFQEYLAAQYLASDPTGNRAKHALRLFLRGEDWWKEVIEFYIISRDDPAAVSDWIKRVWIDEAKKGRATEVDQGDRSSTTSRRRDLLAAIIRETFSGFEPNFGQ